MTSSAIVLNFNKAPGNLEISFIAAKKDRQVVKVDTQGAAEAVSDIFRKLIERDRTKYETALLNLSDFSVTVTTDPASGDIGLSIQNPQFNLTLKKLKPETAELFRKSLNLSKDQSVIPAPIDPQEQLTVFRSQITAQFCQIGITLPNGKVMQFGDYLLSRIFGEIEKCEFNYETLEFTLTLAKELNIPITQLPKDKSRQLLANFSHALQSTLCTPKQVKGKLSKEEAKLSFEKDSLRLDWAISSAHLIDLTGKLDGSITVHGKYGLLSGKPSLSAQDFVDFLECNLPQEPIKA